MNQTLADIEDEEQLEPDPEGEWLVECVYTEPQEDGDETWDD